MLDLAQEGLNARNRLNSAGDNETGFLTPLQDIVDLGRTPAERKLELFEGAWNGSVDPVFSECAY